MREKERVRELEREREREREGEREGEGGKERAREGEHTLSVYAKGREVLYVHVCASATSP